MQYLVIVAVSELKGAGYAYAVRDWMGAPLARVGKRTPDLPQITVTLKRLAKDRYIVQGEKMRPEGGSHDVIPYSTTPEGVKKMELSAAFFRYLASLDGNRSVPIPRELYE